MTETQLLTAISYVVDEAGQRKAVQLDLAVWEEIRALATARLQQLERDKRIQAYEDYYATRTPQDEAEELDLLTDFTPVEAEIRDDRL